MVWWIWEGKERRGVGMGVIGGKGEIRGAGWLEEVGWVGF